jgi:hypothetical protein
VYRLAASWQGISDCQQAAVSLRSLFARCTVLNVSFAENYAVPLDLPRCILNMAASCATRQVTHRYSFFLLDVLFNYQIRSRDLAKVFQQEVQIHQFYSQVEPMELYSRHKRTRVVSFEREFRVGFVLRRSRRWIVQLRYSLACLFILIANY